MKKLDEGYKPRFLNMSVEGYEKELSPELRALVDEFARQMVEEYHDRRQGALDLFKRYPDDDWMKERYAPGNLEKFASGADDKEAIDRLRKKPFKEIDNHDIQAALEQDPKAAALAVKAIHDGAADYVSAGLYASNAIGFNKPFERAQFMFIRNGFMDDWQPRGAIEAGLVDMLAQSYVAWQFWLKQSFDVANHLDDVREQVKKSKDPYEAGTWNPPRLTASEYLERATQMADRFQRVFLRTLRQMRDLRRYMSPVIVQNAGQVNIASDGGQQVNVQQKKKNPAKAKQQGRTRQLKAVK
jgi:hypothetical protein